MSAAIAAAAAAAATAAGRYNSRNKTISTPEIGNTSFHHHPQKQSIGRYEALKRQDWNKFRHFLQIRSPSVSPSNCSGAEVIEFLDYLDQIENTKVHKEDCRLIGYTQTTLSPCPCPLRRTEWASLNGLIGRLFVAYDENVRSAGKNPFRVPVVRTYLQEMKESQAKGIAECRKKSQEIMGRHTP